jgi:glycosyltransferase involved in cell wall biosynthesis
VGEGDHLATLQAEVKAMGLDEHVRFLGFRTGREKMEILRQTRVLAYTSPKEGWGLSVIEGNALGIPCVASDSPGLRESVKDGETGFLVPHGDVETLADRLVRLLRGDDLWWQMGQRGQEWAATFSWDRAARETMALAEEAIERWKTK